MKEFEHILECLKLQKKGTAGDKQGIFDISNKERIGKSEVSLCGFIPTPFFDLPNQENREIGLLFDAKPVADPGFPRGGTPTPTGARQLIFDKFFPNFSRPLSPYQILH